jgi:glucose-6-phosphate isomerase
MIANQNTPTTQSIKNNTKRLIRRVQRIRLESNLAAGCHQRFEELIRVRRPRFDTTRLQQPVVEQVVPQAKIEQLLAGAYSMDCHFAEAPLEKNAPVLLAMVGIWNRNFLGYPAQALLPYDQALHRFPAYMQQAEMESNGKSVNWGGQRLHYPSSPLIWGEVGINGQHAFYQFLHQGTDIVPADFIGSVVSNTPVPGHHDALMANFFAQSQALMNGIDADQVRTELRVKGISEARIAALVAHKVHPGNRPSNTLLMHKLDARTLGALIALYEHKIFVQGIIWQVHSFDQWGVELGKVLASGIMPELAEKAAVGDHDASTRNLIEYYKHKKQELPLS